MAEQIGVAYTTYKENIKWIENYYPFDDMIAEAKERFRKEVLSIVESAGVTVNDVRPLLEDVLELFS